MWSAESREALAAVAASVAALAVFTGAGEDDADPAGIIPSGDAVVAGGRVWSAVG